MNNIDDSLSAFELYKKEIENFKKEDLSESDTRSKLVDFLLIQVLGWQEKDIKREGHVDSGYYDYKISIPGIIFLVEAKKQYKEFFLPSNHNKITLRTLSKQNSEVINQLRSYALDEGVQYGLITNGYQFILTKISNIDGKPWKDNYALIFNGLTEVEKRFIEFYENLSKFGLINNGGFKFDYPITNVEGKTVLSSLVDKDKELVRNSFSAILAPLVDQIFGEMFSEERQDDVDFIKQCFVENAETKKNLNEIERLFMDEAPELESIVPIVNSDNLANAIVKEISNAEISIKISHPPKPIILIGSKGAGKTTFINHLFKYKFRQEEFDNHFIVYIDFRKFFETKSNFEPEKIADEILENLYSKYEELELHSLKTLKRIYIKEIKRNDESIWYFDKENDERSYQQKLSSFLEQQKSDHLRHLTFLSHYLIRERRRRLIVIIDNADQFKDPIQEQLFIFSHSLTKSSLCGTVISLREGYYRKWQNSPPFDAYESNVYHVTAPPYSEILQRRLDYAIDKVKKQEKPFEIVTSNGRNITLTKE